MALRIKDNVDLKELEKFGIKKGYNVFANRERLSIDFDRVISVGKDLWWDMNYYYGHIDGEDILYDLIQAGLVEKV